MLYIFVTMATIELPGCGSWLIERLGFWFKIDRSYQASAWCSCAGCQTREAFPFGWDFSVVGFDPIRRFARYGTSYVINWYILGDGDACGRERDPRGRGFSFGAVDRR
jgi:hypothetical protein